MITPTGPSLSPKMFTTFVLILVCPLALTLASQPPDAEGQTIQLSPINVSDDITTTEFNASNEVHIQCDGDKYGYNPNVGDCENARTIYKRSAVPFTFGERHMGHGSGVFPLPFRFMGGTLFEFTKLPPCSPNCLAKTQVRQSFMLFRACPGR